MTEALNNVGTIVSLAIPAHNHPGGNPTPSPLGMEVPRRPAECGRLLGIDVLDHVVIGEGGRYASFKECGML